MKNHIDHLEIKNFKTLKNVKFDCKKINLFIGRPNVGKSNLLEAISLLGATHANYASDRGFLSEFIRYKKMEELFYDKEIGNSIEVDSNIGSAFLRYHFNIDHFDFIMGANKDIENHLKTKGSYTLGEIKERFNEYAKHKNQSDKPIKPFYTILDTAGKQSEPQTITYHSPVKKYDFSKLKTFPSRFHFFLSPPNGSNLYTIIQHNKKLYREISNLFRDYKLQFILDSDKSHMYLQKLVNGIGISFDYSGIADTLQRYIFYMMAIETNKESVLLFEEPEAHSYPQYITDFAQRVISDKTNQFFITTHSPYVLNTIIENAPRDQVAVYEVDYKKYQTQLKPLPENKISDALNYGNDIIFNL